eukprot:gnl/MRDRNA2_/MRDRNA2_102445_c0_seq1.p1 gnl/MRDRNA2_/MRDRNA2_102445_c0~~gnl/MRDRNA2_/MRDRNA2_102445_c0_seq1.p1  ORF type:complete len:549 (+),score=95.64 gnl/MRDRNA2_/MRDRNA2_102445_c0_seq1:88-1734(+)
MNSFAAMCAASTKITKRRKSLQTSGIACNSDAAYTPARSRRAVARVVELLILICMPQLSSCAQMNGSRLQLSKRLSKHRVVVHGDYHVALALQSEGSSSASTVAPQLPVLLQVSEDHEESEKVNKTAIQTKSPWVQPGSITKRTDAAAALRHMESDSTPVVAAPKATNGFQIQNFHETEVLPGNDVAKAGVPAPDPTVSAGFQVAASSDAGLSDRSSISDQDIDVAASGSSENVVRGLAAIQQQLPAMMLKLNGGAMAVPAFIAAGVFAIVILVWMWVSLRWSKASGPRSIVEALKLSYGTQVESLLHDSNRYDSVMQTPLSQGNVLRIQGRVVPATHGIVTSPLWQKESVMYSASVTPKNTNGQYGSPITVHSCSVDFAIQLLDAPHIQLAVCGQDAVLFDMIRGVCEKDLTLAEAGENWQDFVLNHAGAERASAAFESDDLVFQFREVALSVGAVVTCVGEVRRDQYGVLGLLPWQKKHGYTKSAKDLAADGCDPLGSDLEKVMISDDASLFPKSSRHTIPWDCCADIEEEDEGDVTDVVGQRPGV